MKKDNLTIALLIPHYQNMFSSFYTLEIIKEASKAAIKSGVDLVIETSWTGNIGSGILFADILGNEGWVKKADKEGIPYLILNCYAPCSKNNCIGIDNEKATREAVKYLIEAGHRRIAVITGKLNAAAGIGRLEGFKRALKEARINLDKNYIVTGDWTKESGRFAAEKLFALKDPPTAVFVSGDEMALGAMEAARDKGLKIPEDVSFVGFDNIPQAGLPGISLTTIEQPFFELARLGIESLVKIIRKKPKNPVRVLLGGTRLIKRGSVKYLSR